MTIKSLSAIAIVTVALSSPVFAQDNAEGAVQKPVHTPRHFHSAYNQAPGYDYDAPRAVGQVLESEEIRPGERPYFNVPGN